MDTKMFFAGDFIITNKIENRQIISEKLKKKIEKCEIVCCNFEGPIIGSEDKYKKKIGPNISNNIDNTRNLINCGFNLFCLANNHIYDYGKKGIENTIIFLKEEKVDYIGAGIQKEEIYKVLYKKIDDKRFAFINIAENGFGAAIENDDYGYAYMFNEKILNDIGNIKKKVDILILIIHAGAEHWNVPLPEYRKIYKNFIDNGVDVIIGHHPHIPQGIEVYKGKLIVYSLGNFAFNKGKGPACNHTFSIILKFSESRNIDYEIIPTTFSGQIIDIDTENEKEILKVLEKDSEILENEEMYLDLINKKCLEAYEGYKKAYEKVTCIYRGNMKERIKGIIKRYILRNSFQDIWLYHNITIETHLWICKRATRLLLKRNKIL